MIASQILLSQLQIPYPQVAGGNPQQVYNDFAGAVIYGFYALKAGSYRSPGNLPLPSTLPGFTPAPGLTMAQAIQMLADNPLSPFDVHVIQAMSDATSAYYALVTSGDLVAIHSAADAINALLPLTKQPGPFAPPPDLTILQCSSGILGQVAQQLPDLLSVVAMTDPAKDPNLASIFAAAVQGAGPASMQPTTFFPLPS